MFTDITFLKALRDKLKGGNTKSIHLNVLPGRYATRLDFANLNYIQPGLAENFLEILLTKACFDFRISFDGINLNVIQPEEQKRLGLLSKRLNALNIENEDNYKEHGIKTFGFGFPILIKPSKQDPKKIIKAPLFIWQLEIIKATNKVNTWSILRNKTRNENGKIVDEEIHSIELNEVLRSFLKTDENILVPQINEELLEDSIIDQRELIDECYKVLKALNINIPSETKDNLFAKTQELLKNIPEAANIESISGNLPWIIFGGVFGLFRTQKESIITDIDKIIERFNEFEFEQLKVKSFPGTPHSAIETDPSQQEILATLSIEPAKIIQGPPGTGKSQSLTALITNALANNLKCLVVCEKKTALDVIKNNLHRESDQLGALAAVVEDINKDREGIVNSVRDRLSNLSQYANFDLTVYNNSRQLVGVKVKEVNEQHKELDKKIYQDKTWTKVVGEFLKREKKVDLSVLKTKLDYKQFLFHNDENELSEILSNIKVAKKLYEKINRLDHPLEILNDEIFREVIPMATQLKLEKLEKEISKDLRAVKSRLEKEVSEYQSWLSGFYENATTRIEQLNQIIKSDLKQYGDWLHEHFEAYYWRLKSKIKDYQLFVSSNFEKFGEVFYKNDALTKFKINALSTLFKKYKEIKANRLSLIEQISEIKDIHLELRYFGHDYIEEKHLENLRSYVSNISRLSDLADQWHDRIGTIRDGYIKNLSSNSLHPGFIDNKEQILSTENMFYSFATYIVRDEKLSISTSGIETHFSKIDELIVLLNQLKELENIKKYYANKLCSNKIHFYYLNNSSALQETENIFEEIISVLNTQQILKRASPASDNHFKKIVETNDLQSEMQIISQNLEDFREYFDWRKFYIEISPLQQTVIKSLIEIKCQDWEATFESWYYSWILAIAESNLKYLPKNDDKITELVEAKKELRTNQIKSIISNWSSRQYKSTKNVQANGLNPISIFNKRGSRGERRNSLRKIIKTDFQLFTDFFPVVMLSPTICSSIIPLEEGVFDLVIFDEASQLRLEDTFPALLRGKIKVVSGDSQQMPPSNFFQGGTTLLNPTDEDYEIEQTSQEIQISNRNINNSLDLADSESLLVYAENCNYKQSYLKVHYRSQHPHLIDFSNHAFYGKRLIPMPAKHEYKAIQFIEVNGLYEDQVNRDEARQVVDILLNHIKPFKEGKYPSVGIATFNLYQRNLILEEITKVRQQNTESDKKIADLGSDLFVKNLENIQGDERDIIIISTTFGRRSDGTFRQNFGPIIQGKGYKLLNVIVTRAKFKVYVCCSIPQERIKDYSSLLQQSKNTGRGIFYAYLAYAKAVSEGNNEMREILLKQLYENCESKSFDIDHDVYGSESPFEEEVYYRLAEKIGQKRLQQQYPVGGFKIDLVVKSESTNKPIIAIECDGAKYHSSNEAYAWDIFRQARLEDHGFIFYRIWSTNWWHSAERELGKLVTFIYENEDRESNVLFNEYDSLYQDEIIYPVVGKNAEPFDPHIETTIAGGPEKHKSFIDFLEEEIIPINIKNISKPRVQFTSTVTVKNPEGKILKVKFNKTQAIPNLKPDSNGIITIYERSPLALAIFGRSEGEICQLGMLELYYEILKVE